MNAPDIFSESFRSAVEKLKVPAMGTETVAPLLSLLIQFTRPRRVLEVGMGYTTPFIAAALAGLEQRIRTESCALAEKTRPYLDRGIDLDDDWMCVEPALLTPTFYREPYRTEFVAVDNMSIAESSAPAVREVLRELALHDRVTIINADLRDCLELLPEELTPIDLAWVDAWECLYFFDCFWDLINPNGGIVVMHYLMTYPEGESILDYVGKVQRARPGELELLNLLEPHKLVQNSITVLRRTSAGKARQHAQQGGRVSYRGPLREDAIVHVRGAER